MDTKKENLIFRDTTYIQKLYLYDKNKNEWIRRAYGYIELFQNISTKKVRVIMYENKTLHLRLNHYINSTVPIMKDKCSDKCLIWFGMEYVTDDKSGKQNIELMKFKIKFHSEEKALIFNDIFEKGRNCMINLSNADLLPKVSSE